MHGGAPQPSPGPTVIGRYAIYDAIASGGMATVHLGRLVGPAGFSRTVAVKKLHPALAADPEIAAMLLDEARLAARIQHPNVVPTIDVVMHQDQILLVMEYVRGDSLSRLIRAAQLDGLVLPPNVVVAILLNALAGLHAAHEAIDERGQPMGLVHRDVSPQNIMVGLDGVARVLDFGIAKAEGRLQSTKEGEVKGKVMYMSKEQLAAEVVTRSSDIYAAGIILFEALTCTRMFSGEGEMTAITRIIANDLKLPSRVDRSLAPFDAIVVKAAAGLAADRYATAREMAQALEAVCPPASAATVGDWVQKLLGNKMQERARLVADIERSTTRSRAAIEAAQFEQAPVSNPPPHSGVHGVHTSHSMQAMSGLTGPIHPHSMTPMPFPSAPYGSMPVPPSHAPQPPRSSGLLVLLAIIGFLILGSIGGAGIVLSRRKPVVQVAPAVSATVSVAAPAPSDPPADEPVASAPPPLVSVSAAPTAAPAPRAVGRAKPKCDPPFYMDNKGHKHFYPECM